MSDRPLVRAVTTAVTRLQQWWAARDDGGPGTTGGSPRPPATGARGRILPEDHGPVALEGVDHLEWYVGNAGHTALWLERLGFRVVARQGPDTGVQDIVTLVLDAGAARLLLTTGLTPNHDATRSVSARGDAVLDVAFRVEDVEAAYGRLVHSGLEPDHLPVELRDDDRVVSLVPVTTVDEVLHTLVARAGDTTDPAAFAPGFVAVDSTSAPADPSTAGITAVTTVVQPGRLDEVLAQYTRLFELAVVAHDRREDVEVAVLARPDAVVEGEPTRVAGGALRLVFVAPARRTERNHLDEFLFRHGGPGVRTVTLATAAFGDVADAWQRAGVALLAGPDGSGESPVGGGPRRTVTEPLQARSPIVVALEEVGADPVDPLPLAWAEEAALAAHRAAHPDAEPLGTWAGGR